MWVIYALIVIGMHLLLLWAWVGIVAGGVYLHDKLKDCGNKRMRMNHRMGNET